MGLIDKLFSGIQYLLPHHFLSRLVYAFTRIRLSPVKNVQITLIGSLVGVQWAEAKIEKISEFEHFNAFFTRELANGMRPIDPDPLSFISPSDGRISECGRITNDRILQGEGVNMQPPLGRDFKLLPLADGWGSLTAFSDDEFEGRVEKTKVPFVSRSAR